MTRFAREWNGELGAFWQRKNELGIKPYRKMRVWYWTLPGWEPDTETKE